MSLSSFMSVFSGADRLSMIRRLVAPDDSDDGIIDEQTACDKAYWESVGPSQSTGTVPALVVDILNFLSGAEPAGTWTNIGQAIKIDESGNVAIGGDIDPVNVLTVIGHTKFVGDMYLPGAKIDAQEIEIHGKSTLNSDAGSTTIFDILKVTRTERNIQADYGQNRMLIDNIDSPYDIVFTQYGTDADAETELGSADAKGYGFLFKTEQTDDLGNPGSLLIERSGTLVAGQFNRLSYFDEEYISGTGAAPRIVASGSRSAIVSHGRKDASLILAAESSLDGHIDGFNLKMSSSSGDSGTLIGAIDRYDSSNGYDGELVFTMSKHDINFYSFNGNDTVFRFILDNERKVELRCDDIGLAERTIGGAPTSLVTSIRAHSRLDAEWRLGHDSWHEWSSLRLWNSQLDATGLEIGSVAIGAPIGGDVAAPIDIFNVIDGANSVVINGNYRDIYDNHYGDSGLWIGTGAGRPLISFRDDGGLPYTPMINMGVDSGRGHIFMDTNNVIRVLPGGVSPGQYGVDYLGYSPVPHLVGQQWTAPGEMSSDLNNYVTKEDVSTGSSALAIVTDGGSIVRLAVKVPGSSAWYYVNLTLDA